MSRIQIRWELRNSLVGHHVLSLASPPARRPRNAACRPHGSRSILNTQPCRGISEARVSGYTICPHPHNGHSRQSSLFDEPNHAARRTFYCQTLAAQSVFFPGGPLPCSIKLVFFSVVVLLSYYLLVADIIQFQSGLGLKGVGPHVITTFIPTLYSKAQLISLPSATLTYPGYSCGQTNINIQH